jgi:lipoyl(octanoyl) transferase
MLVKHLGLTDYAQCYQAMQDFTATRASDTSDELWICEHPPVFTQGLAGQAAHILVAGSIAIVQTNRGGQVTYHGPGQVVAYPLINLQRAGYFVKEYVYRLEEAVIRTLAEVNVTGHRVAGAPGIYVRISDPGSHALLAQRPQLGQTVPDELNFDGLGKIAALGIKVSRHCTYHGLALNVNMDLSPYKQINPCGYQGLQTIDLSTIGVTLRWQDAAQRLTHHLVNLLAP